jgi:hypothetical protein
VDPRDRILGPIATESPDDREVVIVDFGDLVRKLILSDEVILESIRLKEIPWLVQKFGYDGVTALLRSGRVRIHCDALTFGEVGDTTILQQRAKKGPLPLGSYAFSLVQTADRKEYMHGNLQCINEAPGLKARQAQKLRRLVAEKSITPPVDKGKRAREQFERDLETNAAVVKRSVAVAARREYGRQIAPHEFELGIERIDEQDWRSETNLGERARLTPERVDKVVQRGLLAVGGLNLRTEYMERYSAMTGFQAGELSIMEDKLGFLARQLDPDIHVERFERVIELTELPDVDPSPDVRDVDLPRLLEIVSTDEVQQFRRWLRGIDSLNDKEIRDEIHRIRDLVARAARGGTGKTVRVLTTTGVGIVAPPVGAALGALDMFLTEKILPEPGPTAFLSHLYRSIFLD